MEWSCEHNNGQAEESTERISRAKYDGLRQRLATSLAAEGVAEIQTEIQETSDKFAKLSGLVYAVDPESLGDGRAPVLLAAMRKAIGDGAMVCRSAVFALVLERFADSCFRHHDDVRLARFVADQPEVAGLESGGRLGWEGSLGRRVSWVGGHPGLWAGEVHPSVMRLMQMRRPSTWKWHYLSTSRRKLLQSCNCSCSSESLPPFVLRSVMRQGCGSRHS